jgi:16S rRNA (adenine1518-N6/adenine1519-N6)-dimethyltransferase
MTCGTSGRAPRFSPRSTVPYHRQPKLGQHFLADPRFRRRIAESIELRTDDLVIEIGAGRGAMTHLLAERARRVVALELDLSLVEQLKKEFGTEPRIEIQHTDILSADLAAICRREDTSQCFVFGNLPYYITSPIIERLRNFRSVIRAMALLVQKEVADRIVAAPGSSHYGYLSVFVQLFSQPRLLFGVPPGAFSPPPQVHSALVGFLIEPKLPALTAEEQEKFLSFVKRCFAQKRKNIINNLSGMASRVRLEQEIDQLHLPATVRAEQMTIEQFANLFARLG